MPSTPYELAIDLQDVAKVYRGQVHALQGIEMKVARGQVFGLLGPNGAGKSTLVKIMMTVIRPTRAVGTILGQPVGHKPALARVGYLPENHRFPRYLTGRQILQFFGALARVDKPNLARRTGELLETVGMTAWADKKVASYSKGMMQRIGLAQALVNDPDLVVLDEPTDGVDPVGRRDIRDVLGRLREQGKTVFVNSHLLSELEMICDRVAILVQGKVARQGTIDDLTAKSQRYDIELEPGSSGAAQLGQLVGEALGVTWAIVQRKGPPSSRGGMGPPTLPGPGFAMAPPPMAALFPPSAPPPMSVPLLRSLLPDGVWAELDGALLSVGTADAPRVQPLLDALRRQNLIVKRLLPVRQTLEDLFIEAVTDPISGIAYAPGAARQQSTPQQGARP